MSQIGGQNSDKTLHTAVLFLVFNRPETTSRVFEAIRKARPPRLYVAADGPRLEKGTEEQERVALVRNISTAVDWPCEVVTLFRENNLGCKVAIANAITWFFENEEQGIILEDDCLPSESFFHFCETLLERYKDDQRIWQVSGYNLTPSIKKPFDSSYIYSRYGSIWGWATWRRSWAGFNTDLAIPKSSGLLDYVVNSISPQEYPQKRRDQFENVIGERVSTWDYQWFYHRVANSGLSVVPESNLISNIGFGPDATNTVTTTLVPEAETSHLSFPLVPPPCVVADRSRDVRLLDSQYKEKKLVVLTKKLKRKVIGLVKRAEHAS